MTTMAVVPSGFPRLPRVDAGVGRQLARYAVVGALGTGACTLFYLVFRAWWDAVPANLAAIVLSTVLSTEANRRFTFDGARYDCGDKAGYIQANLALALKREDIGPAVREFARGLVD